MKKFFFKNITVEEIIKAMESKFFSVFKRYDLGNRYMEIPQKLYLQAL